jgi:hypothetical protein
MVKEGFLVDCSTLIAGCCPWTAEGAEAMVAGEAGNVGREASDASGCDEMMRSRNEAMVAAT